MKLRPEELLKQGGISSLRSGKPDDLFVVCASFEPRTRYVAESLAADYRVRHSVIYVNREFLEGASAPQTKHNLYRLIERLARHSERVSVVEGSWLSAVEQINSLRKALSPDDPSSAPLVVTLDSTTFNRESLITTVLLLRAYHPKLDCRVAYASPQRHGKWLSSGFRSIRNVMGLSGTQLPSRPTLLVVLSGFEPHRTQKVIEEHEPTKVLFGVGDPPTMPEFLDRNLMEQKLMLARQDVEEFRFSAGNIDQCRKTLEELLAPHVATSNVVIAPMSTKFSAIAALLLTETFPEVQLTYCLPGEYNVHDYSTGVSALFVEALPNRGEMG